MKSKSGRSNRSSRRLSRKMKWGGADDVSQEPTFNCTTCTCTKCFELEAHVGTEGLSTNTLPTNESSLLPIDNIESMLQDQKEEKEEVPSVVEEASENEQEKEKEGGRRKKGKKRRSSKKRYKKRKTSRRKAGRMH